MAARRPAARGSGSPRAVRIAGPTNIVLHLSNPPSLAAHYVTHPPCIRRLYQNHTVFSSLHTIHFLPFPVHEVVHIDMSDSTFTIVERPSSPHASANLALFLQQLGSLTAALASPQITGRPSSQAAWRTTTGIWHT